MMNRILKQDVESVVIKYEKRRFLLQQELDRRREIDKKVKCTLNDNSSCINSSHPDTKGRETASPSIGSVLCIGREGQFSTTDERLAVPSDGLQKDDVFFACTESTTIRDQTVADGLLFDDKISQLHPAKGSLLSNVESKV